MTERDAAGPADFDVFDLSIAGMVVADRSGRILRVNRAFADLLGRRSTELMGASLAEVVGTDGRGPVGTALGYLLATPAGTARMEVRSARPDGTPVSFDLDVRPLTGAAGEVDRFLAQAVDTTARTLAADAEAAEIGRLEEAQRVARIGSFEQDLATGQIEGSDELCRLSGLDPGVPFDIATLMERVHPDDRDRLRQAIGRMVADGIDLNMEHRIVLPDGTLRWTRVRAERLTEGRDRIVGTVLDITERKLAEEALEYETHHDALTGLANRVALLGLVDDALRRTEERSERVAILLLDLDDFKTVNDSLGHPVGDELLAAVAHRLAGNVRAADAIARVGGDEFAVLLGAGVTSSTARACAERIVDALRAPFELPGAEVAVSASIGIALSDGSTETPDLLRDADLAMYLAKRNGRGRFEMARPGMQEEALHRLVTGTDLRRALDNDEFEVYYQAIVGTHDRRPVGAEALVRWHHPRWGLVPPRQFIEIAESVGLIVPLGDWVLGEACRQAQEWRSTGVVDGSFSVSVNLSSIQLAEAGLLDTVAGALRDSELPPVSLVLEVTESALMLDFDVGLARLEALKGMGLRLAIDDYGTGFSSLNRLARLPVDIVKIDKSFIDRLAADSGGRALIQSVIDVTMALGMSSIAEGVEAQAQFDMLRDMGCTAVQGYLFARPMPAEDAARSLEHLRSGA